MEGEVASTFCAVLHREYVSTNQVVLSVCMCSHRSLCLLALCRIKINLLEAHSDNNRGILC